MRIRLSVPDSLVGPATIHPALESVTRLNEALIRKGLVPRLSTLLRHGAVKWLPEPAGHGEHFDAADTVAVRRWGDCDDLAPYWAGELRATGADQKAKVIIRKSGPHRWHAVVLRSDGKIDDPSAAAGMPSRSTNGIHGGFDRPMRAGAPFVDVVKWPGHGWLARADLPMSDYLSLAHYATAQEPRQAVAEAAISGACHGVLHGLEREACILGSVASSVAGYGVEGASELWDTEVGSIFSSLSKAASGLASLPSKATGMASGLASGLVSNLPGAASALTSAIPGASALVNPLMQAAAPALQSVLQTGMPLAQQLLPLLVPGLPAAQMGLPILQALMASQLQGEEEEGAF